MFDFHRLPSELSDLIEKEANKRTTMNSLEWRVYRKRLCGGIMTWNDYYFEPTLANGVLHKGKRIADPLNWGSELVD